MTFNKVLLLMRVSDMVLLMLKASGTVMVLLMTGVQHGCVAFAIGIAILHSAATVLLNTFDVPSWCCRQ